MVTFRVRDMRCGHCAGTNAMAITADDAGAARPEGSGCGCGSSKRLRWLNRRRAPKVDAAPKF